jgi:PAS domain S-box-containing protein
MRGEQALARLEQRAARILDRMADMHCVLDAEFRVVALNAAAERLTGRTRASAFGLPHWEAFPESYGSDMGEAYRRVAAEGIEQHLQHRYIRNGQDVHLEIDAYPTDEGGVAIFARDVTEKVRAREASQKIRAQRFLTQLGDALYALNDVDAVRVESTRLLADQLSVGWAAYGARPDGDSVTYVIQSTAPKRRILSSDPQFLHCWAHV